MAGGVAAEHASDFVDAFSAGEHPDRRPHAFGFRDLSDGVVCVGARRDLREMRDDEHLMRDGEPHESGRHAVRHLAPDPRINLVEHKHRQVVHLDERGLEREHEATHLSPGGDAPQRRRREARIQGDEKLDPFGTGPPDLAVRVERDLETGARETQFGECVRHRCGERAGRHEATFREFGRQRGEFG